MVSDINRGIDQMPLSVAARTLIVCALISTANASPAWAQSVAVGYRVTSNWQTGLVAEITLTNTGSVAIPSWKIEFDFGGQLVGLWNGQLTASGTHYAVRDAGWNGNLAPGGSAVFGFQVAYSGAPPAPTHCLFNGSACAFPGEVIAPPASPPPSTTPLGVSISSPAAGETVSGTVSINANVSAPSGARILGVYFAVDGVRLGGDSVAPYSYSWNTATAAPGGHTLTARVTAWTVDTIAATASRPVSVTIAGPSAPPPPSGAAGFLSMSGPSMIDASGRTVRLTGVNWFGFETATRAPHGLWSRDYRSMLQQVRDLGFNALRIPWSNAILEPGSLPTGITFSGSDPYDGRGPMNQPLQGKTSMEVLDLIVAEAGRLGLKIILDNHSRKPDDFIAEGLWYLPDFPESRWIDDWKKMAARYRNNPTVVAFDLHNEPHAQASWGGDPATDFASAAERAAAAIHSVHPDVIIIVGGVQTYAGITYWWGGNLRGVRDRPLRINPAKLLYSAHDYGPEVFPQTWFSAPDYPRNLAGIWDQTWGYIPRSGLGGVFIGEFGIGHSDAYQGRALQWIQSLMAYMGSSSSWTYWSLNPNSGDTGGILKDDWVGVNQWKLDLLTPYQAPQFPTQ
jgi:aryl-phospho-beta-D-glucosidase BglC (GH1 family)